MLLLILPLLASPEILNTIVIDVGHGGYDYGIKMADLNEKSLALLLSKELESALKGKRVFLTRRTDRYLSIPERIAYALRHSPNIFISIHVTREASFSVYISWYPDKEVTFKQSLQIQMRQRNYLKESKALADAIAKEIKNGLKLDISLREMSLPLLNSMPSPALMIEVPLTTLNSKSANKLIANAIADGIFHYEGK